MTLKVTLTINQDFSEDLIGLLTKAFGRGELGIGDIKIERAKPIDVGLKAIRQSRIAKLIEAGKSSKRKARSDYEMGMRAFMTGKPNGVITILIGLSHNGTRDGLAAMWKARGFAGNGLGASLSKLAKRGYITLLGGGAYRLTTKGADLVNRWNAQYGEQN
jgi:hypothetical protein